MELAQETEARVLQAIGWSVRGSQNGFWILNSVGVSTSGTFTSE